MRRASRAAALVLCLLLPAAPLFACCTDFWSCATAVATAGLSCVAEAAIIVVRAVIDRINVALANYVESFHSSVDSLKESSASDTLSAKNSALGAAASTHDALAAARKLAGEDLAFLGAKLSSEAGSVISKGPPGAPPTPTPHGIGVSHLAGGSPSHAGAAEGSSTIGSTAALSNPGLVKDSHNVLVDMENQIEQLDRQAQADAKQAGIKEAEAGAVRDAAGANAVAAFENGFLGKINALLGILQQIVADPVKVIDWAPHAASDLETILVGYDKSVPPILEVADQTMQAAAAAVHQSADDARSSAQQANAILSKMRVTATLLTSAERRAASAPSGIVVPTPTKNPSSRVRAPALAAFATASRKFTDVLRSSQAQLAGLKNPLVPDVTPFRGRVASDFDSAFNGKSPPDRTLRRDGLLAEARKRFAADPKTLQAVEKLIRDEARSRGVP